MDTVRFILVLMFLISSKGINAQCNASAGASATIVAPVQVIKNADIAFSGFNTNGGLGTIEIIANSNGAIKCSNNIVETEMATVSNAAIFIISGKTNEEYSITIPDNEYIVSNGSEDIIINKFVFNSEKQKTEEGDLLYLGATIHLKENQALGLYTNTKNNLAVTINYN
ncbi:MULTISPECIES: DUF4402 domain-containing protein [unclassified Flavobacterium]|uniref:DUF4402 domain-containing protein n=1 Tax=unclassified Flavobacterium TaxID=196869 RepID=UPI003F8FFC00